MFTAIHAGAEELWRLRYSVPTSSESEITRGSSKISEKLNTSGHSGNLVFANGIGFGYSTVRTNGSLEGIDYKFKNHSLDLAYTIGDDLSFTLGAGRLVYGRGEQSLNGTSYVTESSSGEALFMNFGIPFIGVELLLGYRQNNIEYKLFQNRIAGKSVILEDSVILLSSQLNAGLGFLF
ncbi:MAG: hypothetical protein HOI10_01010 [Deltaproteobacteria bacterium]|nr:hypothetical protein [Deltaproteobacteria bacterium]